jgi:hypothetical protein
MSRLTHRLALLALVVVSQLPHGCAHSCCFTPCDACIPYGYCPPAPLAYSGYCGCPTPVASGGKWRSGENQRPVHDSHKQLPPGEETDTSATHEESAK